MNSNHMDGYMFVFFGRGIPLRFHTFWCKQGGGERLKEPMFGGGEAASNYLGGMILLAPTVDLRFAIHHCPFQQHEAMAKREVWL